jgi:hypothetical protein
MALDSTLRRGHLNMRLSLPPAYLSQKLTQPLPTKTARSNQHQTHKPAKAKRGTNLGRVG